MADFTNIDGVYAKDTELRSGIDTLRTTVLSNTIKPLTVTKNGTYTAIPSSGTYGYSPITVDVQEEPWEPLEDGYSNFWFELTNDTLSPWLNFSAKNANATIDWGDGTGEVALDTLTPTHNYAKAGKYVVKVKGVTGIGQQQNIPYQNGYLAILKSVEFNDEITTIAGSAFTRNIALTNAYLPNVSAIQDYGFYLNSALKNITFPRIATFGYQTFFYSISLAKVNIPDICTAIGGGCFYECRCLDEVHIAATIPPTLGNGAFDRTSSQLIIYVPVGTGDTYKAASGWSTYADHIVEEGQSLSMAALRRIQAEKNDNGEEMR